jgi:acyl-coenzyme A synthetase/AMP-(fatty) acid ligase
MRPDGYVRLMDRATDVVLSGGENIATVEIEQALLTLVRAIIRVASRAAGSSSPIVPGPPPEG